MKTKRTCVCVAGLLALATFTGTARAQGTIVPVGLWSGQFSDGSGDYTLLMQGDGGWVININGYVTSGFAWEWVPTSTGGIVTLHYIHAGFHDRLYYSVTYLDGNRIIVSDPYFQVVLYRQ